MAELRLTVGSPLHTLQGAYLESDFYLTSSYGLPSSLKS